MQDPGSATARASRRAAVIAIVVLAAAVGMTAPGRAATSHRAPPFRVETINNTLFDLDRARQNGPVLLDFWATWCRPCLESLPEIQKLYLEYQAAGLTVLGISIDGPRNFPKVRPFARRFGLSYPIAIDVDGDLQRRYQVGVVPTSVLVDTAGRIVRVQQGYRPGEIAELEAALKDLLAPDSPGAAASDSLPPAPDEVPGQAPADSTRGRRPHP